MALRRFSTAVLFVAIVSCLAWLPSGHANSASIYSPWPNGPPQSPSFFPIAVLWQAPTATGRSGPYPTEAAAAAAEHINIFLGLSGGGKTGVWPERFGHDEGELELIKAKKLYLIGGVKTPSTENSSAGSVASMLALAKSIRASSNLIGYDHGR